MRAVDCRDIAAVHEASFPGFFLSTLGTRFLALFYRGVCRSPQGIAFVHLDGGGRPSGFVAGAADPRGFYAGLLRRDWLRFGLAALAAVVRRPAVVPRLLRALRQPSVNPPGGEVAGLFSLGVHPREQGRGAGRELVRAFLDEAVRRGARRVFLTTDRDGNDAVNGFYRRCGFAVGREYATPEGRRMNEYWIELP
jgi:ribosomal protein S18 acetylase RimI-like enzyme